MCSCHTAGHAAALTLPLLLPTSTLLVALLTLPPVSPAAAAAGPGVLVRRINPTSFAAGVIQRDDVLMAFDGQAIACDGTVPFRTGERISFSYLISNKFVGDSAAITLLRGGQEMSVDVK